jgi:NAD+ kinase
MAAPRPRVLVVYKKSAYELHIRDRRDVALIRALRRRDPDAMDMRVAHTVHQQTMDAVSDALRELGVHYDLVYRAGLRNADGYDLIVAVGGDGTLLQVSHLAGRTPILGVNSDPNRSEAVFCAATRQTFPRLVRRALEGRLRPQPLLRLRAHHNDRPVRPLALNDILIAHDDPATMSRYRLRVNGREEFQKSSGVWVSTAAGSSSAVLAAGGRRLSWTARAFQYRPRELYRGRLTHGRLAGAVLSSRSRVEIVWLMREGAAFIDGPHERHALEFGDRFTISLATDDPTYVLGIRTR